MPPIVNEAQRALPPAYPSGIVRKAPRSRGGPSLNVGICFVESSRVLVLEVLDREGADPFDDARGDGHLGNAGTTMRLPRREGR